MSNKHFGEALNRRLIHLLSGAVSDAIDLTISYSKLFKLHRLLKKKQGKRTQKFYDLQG
jgi:hypothetical protein